MLKVVPIEVTVGILLWIGIIITAQAYEAVPRRHALAVAFGLVPSLAAWTMLVVAKTVSAAGSTLPTTVAQFGPKLYIPGLISLIQWFLLTAMLFAALLVHIIDREFYKAAMLTFVAMILALTGLIHAATLTE